MKKQSNEQDLNKLRDVFPCTMPEPHARAKTSSYKTLIKTLQTEGIRQFRN